MELVKRDNPKSFMLSEEVYNEVSGLLDELALKLRADMVVICDTNGYPVCHKGENPDLDLWALSSLAANNFSATTEIASMIGEKDSFKFLFHEGQRVNIYLSNVGFTFILMIIFKADVALGMVRIFTNKAIKELNELLKSAKEAEESAKEFLDLEFKSLLSKELDRSFKL